MERIVYRKTLDVHKNGVQFTLQGFETADKMARKIEISLMASGDTIDLPLEQLSAIMYVTTPNASESSINECTIKDNTIICDILPIVEGGITEIQLKLIETSPEGAKSVLATPKFAIEVSDSNMDDESVIQTTTYTALENALAQAKGVYDKRITNIEIDRDCMFRVVYADGTMYETDALNETLLKGEAILSQSYARGGTGTRTNEDTDNSMYYSNVSRSASEEARRISGNATELLDEATKHGVYTAFSLDFSTGKLNYISPLYSFAINKETGELNAKGETYTPDETIEKIVSEWLSSKSAEITNLRADFNTLENENNVDHEKFQENYDELSQTQETIVTKVDALETNTDTLNANIENLEANVETIDANVQSLSETMNKFADRVIEQGTSGVWSFRKWESGISECWFNGQYPAQKVNTKWGETHYYGYIGSYDFPSKLFIACPNVTVSLCDNTGAIFAVSKTPQFGNTGDIYAVSPMSFDSCIIYISVEAKGRWK